LIHPHYVTPAFAALLQVVVIDIVLAGDNAVAIGLVASRVPKPDRRRVIFWALAAAVALRIVLASLTVLILNVGWLLFAGGCLLLWVAWRLYRDITHPPEEGVGTRTLNELASVGNETPQATTDIRRAIVRVAIADLSMSLDNVLAVAGAAMYHPWVLTIGLVLSVALVGLAASAIANLLQRHPWISYAGLILVVYVGLRMIYFGGYAVLHAM
jgi:YjbE family integral membrane protein